MIKAVFPDFYGTLAHWIPGRDAIQQTACLAEGLKIDVSALPEAYVAADAYMAMVNARLPLSAQAESDRRIFFTEYERIILKTAGLAVSPEKAWSVWKRVDGSPKRLGLYSDVRPTLKALVARGLTVGIISNMGHELENEIDRLRLRRFLKAVSTSASTGVSKPHPAIFKAALVKVGIAAREALHVGDHYESDVVGALRARMQALLLTRDPKGFAPRGCPTIETLGAIIPYLNGTGRLIDSA